MKPRILELEIVSCSTCPFSQRCNSFKKKDENEQFANDCPFSWHEINYDYIKELEAENAHLTSRVDALTAQAKNYEWIPVKSGIAPKLGQSIITTILNKNHNITFLFCERYSGDFLNASGNETLAWTPAPDEYKPKESALPAEYEEKIMNRFVRVE